MPYIGRAATNAGSVNYLDDISSGFDGSDTTFTCAISGTTITPGQENVFIYLDGVFQDPGSSKAYTISGSTITFTEAPANGTVFTGYVAGEGAYLDDGTVSTAKLDDDAVTASKLDDDGTGFQVGDLGVGGSLTSGDKLTVTGRLRASGGIIGDLTGDVTGDLTGNVTGNVSGSAATVTGAAQSAITSLGTLTSLTVDDMTLNGSTISDAGAFDIDAGGVIKLDAGGGQIQFFDDGTEIGVFENSSSDFVIESKVQDKDILFRGNDGGTGIEVMRMNMSGANVGISTGNSIGAKLHVADNRSTAYDGTAEPAETMIIHNKNGSDGSGVNNYASLSWQVADGATSQGFLNFKRTGDNLGYFTFTSRTGSSEYKELLWINGATNNWTMNVTGNSPYGMQITTTASNSSSHDMFKIKRGDGTTCFDVYGDGNVYIPAGNLTTTGTILAQGLSNYTGLEVKGAGGSRPQVKFTNVNNGTLGSIYGTESNGLEITSGTNGYSAISVSSAQEVTLATAVKFEANAGATRAKLHWYNASTTLGHQYYHLKTDISYGDATQMYSIHFLGHAYNDSKAIDTILTFYNYDNDNVLAIGSTGNHSATVYESSDGKLVMVLNLGAGNTYYSGFTLSQYHTRQGVADFNVSAITTSNSATGEY